MPGRKRCQVQPWKSARPGLPQTEATERVTTVTIPSLQTWLVPSVDMVTIARYIPLDFAESNGSEFMRTEIRRVYSVSPQ